LYQRAVSGPAEDASKDEALENAPDAVHNRFVDDWSRDGRYIVERTAADPKTKTDLLVMALSGPEGAPRKPVEYLHTEFNEQDARVSPNSRLLAYASDESKQPVVSLRLRRVQTV
jgi:hypothetical protein